MTSKNIVLGAAAAVGIFMLMRLKNQGAAWTVPGSQQDAMIAAQDAAFNSTYENAYTYSPGGIYSTGGFI
jgi:hypothetical protein